MQNFEHMKKYVEDVARIDRNIEIGSIIQKCLLVINEKVRAEIG